MKYILIIVLSFVISFPIQALSWPTSGWIAFRYKNTTQYCSGNCHTGIDIWSNYDGSWNGGVYGESNTVYPIAAGVLIWEDNDGFYIQHSSNLYSNYFHLRNRQVSPNMNVDANTLIAYQDFDVKVHLHLTISTTPSDSGHIDPSPYFGLQLDVTKPNVIGSLTTYVTYGGNSNCVGTNVNLSNWNVNGPLTCTASSDIVINPESIIQSTGGTVTLSIQ